MTKAAAGFVGHVAALRGVEPQLASAARWLAQRGADRVVGPFDGAAIHGGQTIDRRTTGTTQRQPTISHPAVPVIRNIPSRTSTI